jgi:hypothetical protein
MMLFRGTADAGEGADPGVDFPLAGSDPQEERFPVELYDEVPEAEDTATPAWLCAQDVVCGLRVLVLPEE